MLAFPFLYACTELDKKEFLLLENFHQTNHLAKTWLRPISFRLDLNLASTHFKTRSQEDWEHHLSPHTCTRSSLSSTSSLFPSVLSSFSSLPFTSSSQSSTALSASPKAWYSCRWRSRVHASWSRAWWEERSSAGTLFTSDRGREAWYRRSRDDLRTNTHRFRMFSFVWSVDNKMNTVFSLRCWFSPKGGINLINRKVIRAVSRGRMQVRVLGVCFIKDRLNTGQ